MRTEKELHEEIKRIKGNSQYTCSSSHPDPILAMIQIELRARVYTLEWVLGIVAQIEPESVGASKIVLNDDSQMPFGKFGGTLMKDVPADYIWYLWSTGSKDKKTLLSDYVRRNIERYKKLLPNKEW